MPGSEVPEIRKIKIADLRPGPIQRQSLSPEQETEIRRIYKYLAPFLKVTFEEFEIGFLRDMQPEKEIAIWGWIQAAHEAFSEQVPDENIGRDLLTCLLMVSFGGEKPPGVDDELWTAVKHFCEVE